MYIDMHVRATRPVTCTNLHGETTWRLTQLNMSHLRKLRQLYMFSLAVVAVAVAVAVVVIVIVVIDVVVVVLVVVV